MARLATARAATWSTAVALFTVSLAGLAAGQPTFRSETELVNLNVTVTDRTGRPVGGLDAAHFQVFEDGVAQTVEFFASGDMPLDVVILLDTSASMAGSMPLVQQAAARFVGALRPHDRAAVMGISDGLRILQAVTADHAAVTHAIQSTKARGRTRLYASIYTALRELGKIRARTEEPRRQALVVLTDGQDTASAFGFNELLPSVRRHAVPIYTIAPRPSALIRTLRETVFGEATHEEDFELRKLASETGGRAFFPAAIEELSGVYDAIADELSQQYALGYHPSNDSFDGKFRQVAVRVDAPNVRWRTRAGYLAERGALGLSGAY